MTNGLLIGLVVIQGLNLLFSAGTAAGISNLRTFFQNVINK